MQRASSGILGVNKFVTLLPLMVAFNIGKALKGGGGFDDGHGVMDGVASK